MTPGYYLNEAGTPVYLDPDADPSLVLAWYSGRAEPHVYPYNDLPGRFYGPLWECDVRGVVEADGRFQAIPEGLKRVRPVWHGV